MISNLAELQGFQQLFAAFLAGLFTSFTPCVYPLIPVTLSIFGATSDRGALRGFSLALSYVFGIAITYTALGFISAKTGTLFGAALGNPAFVAVICLLLILLSLYTLEILKFERVYVIQNRASQLGGQGYTGAFLMGLVSGVVAAPCVGPVLIVILGIVSQSRDPLWGASLMFSYAMGFGVLFLVLGTFSPLLQKLPRSGNWLHAIKFLIAVGLFVVALFLMRAFISLPLDPTADWPIVTALGAVAVLFATSGYRRNIAWRKVLAAIALAFAVSSLIPGKTTRNAEYQSATLEWQSGLESTLDAAKSRDTIAMLDLFADWCAACIELDHQTFPDPMVRAELSKIVIGRSDFTESSDEQDRIVERYKVLGLPTILFLTPQGDEIPGSRVTGFMNAEKFAAHLKKVSEQARR